MSYIVHEGKVIAKTGRNYAPGFEVVFCWFEDMPTADQLKPPFSIQGKPYEQHAVISNETSHREVAKELVFKAKPHRNSLFHAEFILMKEPPF